MAKVMLLSALLASSALGAVVKSHVSTPNWMYKSDCFKNKPVAGLLQYVPGAGIDKFKPFKTVLKDGFSEIDCVKDYMYHHGDKFGDNKHDYKLEDVSHTSIVHYDAHVKKEDRQPMTRDRCFEFCRTVPNMGFFGLTNGRNCYCAPYYKQMAGDSSSCDAVCPGDQTTMCGGQAKSSIFSLHNCDSTKGDLGDADKAASTLATTMDKNTALAKKYSDNMQKNAAALQKTFGAVGDSAAGDLMQKAKVAAGKLVEEAKGVTAISKELKEQSGDAKKISDFKSSKEVIKAERIMENVDATVGKGEGANADLEARLELAHPEATEDGAANQYMNLMHFVDSKYETNPSTCGGDLVNDPITGKSVDGCASACNANFQKCVGFQYFADEKLCFLFSGFNTATYYTGCKSFLQKPAFLQTSGVSVCADAEGKGCSCDGDVYFGKRYKNGKPGSGDLAVLAEVKASGAYTKKMIFGSIKCSNDKLGPDPAPGFKKHCFCEKKAKVACYAKLSRFEGTTLKPDGSGKCKECLKKATKADRCWK